MLYVKLAVLLGPMVLCVGGLSVLAHIAGTRHFDVMCASLRNSKGFLEDVRASSALSLKLRSLAVAGSSMMLIWPEWGMRRGLLDPEDNKQFPSYLRRRVKVAFWLLALGLTWSAIVYGILGWGVL